MKQHDFTSGSIWRQLLTFSTPILLTNLLQVSYQFIDSLWVGNLLGANALGAVAVSSTVIFTVLSFIIGINNATLTILSQLKGKDDPEHLKRYVNAFTVILTALSVGLGVAGFFFAKDILQLLDTPTSMIPEAVSYLQINFIGILFLFGYNFIGTVFRALGNSKTPIRFVLTAVILNTILDPVFIHVFNMGIDGAAYATVVAQGAAFLYGLFTSIRFKFIPFTVPFLPTKEEVSLILKQGIPAGLQMMVISAGMAAIMSVVTSFGGHAVAGFGAAQRLDSLLILPAQALSTAVNSMAGQNIAVHQWRRVNQIALYATFLNLAIMLTAALFIFLFANWSIRLFITDKEAVAFGREYIKMVAFFYPFLGLNFVLNGIVRAAGAMFQVLVLNLISFWVLRYPLTEFFAGWIGERGVALGMGTSFVISSLFAFSYFYFGKWKKKKLFATERD
ncbi:MATE family efflux transporter [Pseudobacillus wudalianchiensis]|uniref:MATE family efflux transporter n=1 Tax=Pseudobacillus wudalianchiensis TaxID=1743143 RepID=A0A1B9AN63_9BACI|nr:MATE family efflux transporter [Bacillus wudalianchiensis]OCA85374.1 MATE family efflux transporter [Bacillus wudalianchiensis]